MPLDTEVRLQVNLGPDAPIEVVTSVLADVNRVCQFGGELQRHVTRTRALRSVLRGSGPLFDDSELDYFLRGRGPYSYRLASAFLGGGLSELLEPEIARWTAEAGVDRDDETLVREISYHNPMDVGLLVAGGGVVLALLRMIRDWPAQRRVNELRADDYADEVSARKRVRTALADAMVSGQLPVSAQQIDRLLTDETVRAIDALGRSRPSLQEPPSGDSGQDTDQ